MKKLTLILLFAAVLTVNSFAIQLHSVRGRIGLSLPELDELDNGILFEELLLLLFL